MSPIGCLLAAALVLQVPPPVSTSDAARELEAARRWIISTETAALDGLAEELTRANKPEAAVQVRKLIPIATSPDGPLRVMPLPEVVGPGGKPLSGTGRLPGRAESHRVLTLDAQWQPKLDKIHAQTASKLFELAQRAAKSDPARYSLASVCLRLILERQPDHPDARRLLGYVHHGNGWARPFAVRQLKEGHVNHPIFGWVPPDWPPHLERGELPAPQGRGDRKTRWLPAAEADQLRANWERPWQITTEHFELRTDVTLAEAIRFGRRLEAFYDLFTTLLADILGENLPLIRRFHDPAMHGEPSYRPHIVFYFASKDEYVAFFQNKAGAPDLEQSLGYYEPPKPGGRRAPAYFYRDPNGQLPVEANLYHEVSHQLLFETAGPNAYTKNVGNYWVFEGLGTYFETVSPRDDGSIEVGGLVGRRIEEALKSLIDQKRQIPLARFVALDQEQFKKDNPQIYLYYQEAMALAVFLMQWRDGTYRDAFLDYVRDAYRGRIKRTSGRSLQDRLGQPYEILDRQFLAFLENGRARSGRDEPTQTKAQTGAIRTVPNP
jgi:hypothetical protein